MDNQKDIERKTKKDHTNDDHEIRQEIFTVRLRDENYREKFISTMLLFSNSFYIGLVVGLAGPSFLDLMLITDTELDQASALFTANGVGYMLGALITGVMYERCNKLLYLGVVVLGNSICTGVTPLCYSFPLMVTVTLMAAVFGGSMATGGNTTIIRLWGKDGKSYIQILHFVFALGGILSPLIVEPFLAPKFVNETRPIDDMNQLTKSLPISTCIEKQVDQNCTKESTDTNRVQQIYEGNMATQLINISQDSQNLTSNSIIQHHSQIIYAYVIVACVGITTSVCFFISLKMNEKKRKSEVTSAKIEQEVPLWVTVTCVAMIGLFFHSYVAAEGMFMSFLTMFTVEGLFWTKANGALVTSVFWASLASGRFLGIFFIRFISSLNMLVSCLVLIVVSLCSFMVFSLYDLTVGIWVSTVGVGLAMSVVFPTAMSWIEEHVIKVTAKVTSVIMIATSFSAIIMPLLLGYLIKNVTFMSYPYFLVFESILLLSLYMSINKFSKYVVSKYRCEDYCESLEEETINSKL